MRFLIIHDEMHLLLQQVHHHLIDLGHQAELVELKDLSFTTRNLFDRYDGIYFDRPEESNAYFWQQILLLSACTRGKIHNAPIPYSLFRNKAAGTVWLTENGFATPDTVFANSAEQACHLVTQKKWEKVMLKPLYGHSGIGITGFEPSQIDINKLNQMLKENGLLYLQEFIPTKPVQDLRVDVVGEKIVNSYFRKKDSDEKYPLCNISRGAHHQFTSVPIELQNEIRRFMKLSGISFAGIDLIWSQKNDRYLWVEVNPEPQASVWQPELSVEIAQYLITQGQTGKSNHD